MTTILRIPGTLVREMRADLRRSHEFAFERVGFLYCHIGHLTETDLILGFRYEPIRDDQYIRDESVGARFDGTAIRHAMQTALQEGVSVFHVHLHDHVGRPQFGSTDRREMQALMPCFVNVRPDRVHGALVLSADSACARAWSTTAPNGGSVSRIAFVGSPMTLVVGP